MRAFRMALAGALASTACMSIGGGAAHAAGTASTGGAAARSGWSLSPQPLPVAKSRAIGLKLNDRQVMWLGGIADDPADNNTTAVYDTRTRTSRETAPIPLAKNIGQAAIAGVLSDGTVVVAGGGIAAPPSDLNASSVLSYRYDPATNRWSRTGDLPEPQQWAFMPTVLLRDGRLLVTGGVGLDGLATGTASRHAFIYNPRLTSIVDAIDPNTGVKTGKKIVVAGRWDYTRRADGRETTLSEGHFFGNEILLHDGRMFVGGGHTMWNNNVQPDVSILAADTEFFDPATGIWSQGPPLPTVPGEDGRIANSHGGRANGVCFATLPDDRVVIAGGNSQVDGQSYFGTTIGRQSILVMTPAANPSNSRITVSPTKIPSGTNFGGFFGDGGRNQLLCYVTTDSHVVFAGGQDSVAEDLYDTYVFNPLNGSIRQGPDLVHGIALWAAADPSLGYPVGYQAAAISTMAVAMRDSRLVFRNDVFVEGGGYDGLSLDGLGSRYVEQFTPRSRARDRSR
jgi:hypothetical protein